jgi:catechol 2,3-dioxygenase-like lactoylglutathione lyase family enzyme
VIHHVTIEVSDIGRSSSFYDSLFASLGWRRHTESDERIGWGIARPWFFVSTGGQVTPGSEEVGLSAPGMAAVKGAWESGISAGGEDDGKPDVREEYGPNHYSAFLRDPDGYRIEIVRE